MSGSCSTTGGGRYNLSCKIYYKTQLRYTGLLTKDPIMHVQCWLLWVVVVVAVAVQGGAVHDGQRSAVHFVTASVLGEGDIKDIRDANFLLKSRLIFGSDVMKRVACSWVVFLPSLRAVVKDGRSVPSAVEEEAIVMGSMQQAQHIASEANCSVIFTHQKSRGFSTVDEMVWVAVQVARQSHVESATTSHILFMLSQAVILSNPLAQFDRMLEEKKSNSSHPGLTNSIFMHLPVQDSFEGCTLNLFLVPLQVVDLFSDEKNSPLYPRSMCSVVERSVKQYGLDRIEVPLFYRFPLELDSLNGISDIEKEEFRYEASTLPIHKQNLPSVLLTVAGHNVDWYLFDARLAAAQSRNDLYKLSDGTSLDCELVLSVPTFNNPLHLMLLPIGTTVNGDDHETRPGSMVNYTELKSLLFPTPSLCLALFGTLQPDIRKAAKIQGKQFLNSPRNEDPVVNSFAAVPDWVMSPEDYDIFVPDYNSDEYRWDGSLPHQKASEEYDIYLKATAPILHFRNPSTQHSSTLCSIQILAYGDHHLHYAYENAIRIHKYSSFSRSNNGDGVSKQADICGGKPLVYLYTFNSSSVLVADALSRSNSFLQRIGNYTIDVFLSAFDGVFDLCDTALCQSFFPSNEAIFSALQSTSQRLSYHTTPSLWWQVSNMLQHPPSRYVMYLDADSAPCNLEFDSSIFNLMRDNNLVTLNQEEYGDTGGSNKYPYPRHYLSRAYVRMTERYRPFSVMDTGDSAVRRLLYESVRIFNDTLQQMLLGRTFVRGDQHCFRQALFYVRDHVSESTFLSDNPYFCSRKHRYKKGCLLYFASDAFEKC